MKIRYQTILMDDWKECDLKDLPKIIKDPKITYEIKIACSHKDTWNDHGETICKRCGDTLEITSYRD